MSSHPDYTKAYPKSIPQPDLSFERLSNGPSLMDLMNFRAPERDLVLKKC